MEDDALNEPHVDGLDVNHLVRENEELDLLLLLLDHEDVDRVLLTAFENDVRLLLLIAQNAKYDVMLDVLDKWLKILDVVLGQLRLRRWFLGWVARLAHVVENMANIVFHILKP